MNQIQVGLIGFGISGQVFHAPFIKAHPGFHLAKVSARKPEQKAVLKEEYPSSLLVEDPIRLLESDDLDVVIIATSNAAHAELTELALKAGKHVVVEKQFTISSSAGRKLIQLAQQLNRTLTVYQNARWNGDFLTIRKILLEGKLGELVTFEARYDRFRNYFRPGAWREADLPGSGILYDLGAHLIDQALVLFGKPKALFANLRMARPGAKAVDDFELLFYYDRLKVSLKASMLVKEPVARYALFGTQGAYVKYGSDPQEAALRSGVPPDATGYGIEDREHYGILNLDDSETKIKYPSEPGNYMAFYNNLYDALLNNTPLAVPAEQALQVIELIELAEKSSHEQKVILFS